MEITLPPDLAEFVEEQVKSGHYDNPDAVVEEAVALLREFTPDHEAYLRREIKKGIDQLDRGEGEPWEGADAILARLHRRAAAKQ